MAVDFYHIFGVGCKYANKTIKKIKNSLSHLEKLSLIKLPDLV